jgi:membrane-associated phospholipid phosphatase
VAIGLSLTRIVVLAHWASDVLAGFALGAGLERLMRAWTGYPQRVKQARRRRSAKTRGNPRRKRSPPAPRGKTARAAEGTRL